MHFALYLNLVLFFYYNFVSYTLGVPAVKRTEEQIYKRNIFRHYKENYSEENTSRKSCTSLLKQCKYAEECKRAVNSVKLKCTVKAGSCNAQMRNLQECGWIMNTLFKHGFTMHHLCLCDSNEETCNQVYTAIYQNPCFDSVMYLKKKNIMPAFEPTRSTVSADYERDVITSDDVIDELLESMSSNQLQNKFGTSTTISSQTLIDQTETTMNSIRIISNETETFYTSNFGKDKILQDEIEADATLLYIIATAIGLCIFLVIAIVAGLICYYWRLLKKENVDARATTAS